MEIITSPHLIASLSTAKKADRRSVKHEIEGYLDDERGSWETSGEQYNKKLLTGLVKSTGLILAEQIYVQPIGVVLEFDEPHALDIPKVEGDDFNDVIITGSGNGARAIQQSVNTLEAGSVCLIQFTFKAWRRHNPIGYCGEKAAVHFLRALNLANRAFTLEYEHNWTFDQDNITVKFISAYSDAVEISQVWNNSQELINDILDSESGLKPTVG